MWKPASQTKKKLNKENAEGKTYTGISRLEFKTMFNVTVIRTWRNGFTLSLLIFSPINRCRCWWGWGYYYDKIFFKDFPTFCIISLENGVFQYHYYLKKEAQVSRELNSTVKRKDISLSQILAPRDLWWGPTNYAKGKAGPVGRARPQEELRKHSERKLNL